MIKSFPYDVGDTVVVKPYTLFDDIHPEIKITEWNEDPYGYGIQHAPGDTFIFKERVDMYAQYEPICVNYYLTGYNESNELTTYRVSYVNRVGTRIQAAEFPGISGFSCWHDTAGNILSSYEYIYLTSNYDLFMSCDINVELQFNGNGAYLANPMKPLSATRHVYVDSTTHKTVAKDTTITLPPCEYYLPGKVCLQWSIDGVNYDFGERYVLSSNTVAYAQWQSSTIYTLNANVMLVNDEHAYRYLLLKVDELQMPGIVGRFSKICFIDEYRNELAFPSQVDVVNHNINNYNDTDPHNAVDGSIDSNVIFEASKLPCGIQFDFKSPVIDVSLYPYFQVWTASNSLFYRQQNFKSFQVYISNNGNDWYLADSHYGSVQNGNSTLMYQSNKIYVSGEPTRIPFDDGGGGESGGGGSGGDITSTYKLMAYAKGNGACVNLNYRATNNTKLVIRMKSDGQYTGNIYIGGLLASFNDNADFRYFATGGKIYFDISGIRYWWSRILDADTIYTIECSYAGLFINNDRATNSEGSLGNVDDNSLYVFGTPNSPVNFTLEQLNVYESDLTDISDIFNITKIRFDVENYGDEYTQFSMIQFMNHAGTKYFVYPPDIVCTCTATTYGSSNETVYKAFDHDFATKMCVKSKSFRIECEFPTTKLNLVEYGIFQIASGNDNSSYPNRSVKNIKISIKDSNTLSWHIILDEKDIPKQTKDYKLSYSVKVNLYQQHKMDIRPAIDNNSRSCLVDVLTGSRYYSSIAGKEIVCSNSSSGEIIYCTVTFNANGGSCLESSRKIQQGYPIGQLPTAEKNEYFFVGWYYGINAGSQIAESTIINEDVVIYARYEKYSDELTYVIYTPESGLPSVGLNILNELVRSSIPNLGNALHVRIGTNVKHISSGSGLFYEGAFAFCYQLQNVDIPNSVIDIDSLSFRECHSLTDIIIPDSVIRISWGAFSDCNHLKSVTIGSGVTYIGNKAFEWCEMLNTMIMNPVSPPKIEGWPFRDISSHCVMYVKPEAVANYGGVGAKWNGLRVAVQS